ncbi:unnamed protein product [Prunus brigantina]
MLRTLFHGYQVAPLYASFEVGQRSGIGRFLGPPPGSGAGSRVGGRDRHGPHGEELLDHILRWLQYRDQIWGRGRDRVPPRTKHTLPALAERGMTTQVSSAEITDEVETAEADWRYPIVKYLRDPSGNHERTTRFRARCYLIYQNELYRKGSDSLLLLCPSTEDIKVIMTESHKGICGAHQSGVKMRWLVRRHGYYWPTILKNCIEYAKGCIKRQIYGPIQRVPVEALHPVTKPWPFRGWAVDIIGKIYPDASNQHAWILVATDYFTKWVEEKSYRSISSTQVVRFFENHIVHRFGIPETITADNGPVFTSAKTREYAERIGIKLVHSTPYYP